MRTLFFYLLAITNLVSVVHLGFYMVGANVYDMKQFGSSRKRTKSARKSKQALVSVVIPAHNEAIVIARTLDSVRASSYSNFEIIVVDDGSTDGTAEIVQGYIDRNNASRQGSGLYSWFYHRRLPGAPIGESRISLVRQLNMGKATAMNNALITHVQGKYFMCLDADSTLHPEAISRAIAHFDDPSIIGVAANVRIIESNTILGTLQRFEHLVGYRAKKFYSMTNSEFIVGGVASTYLTRVVQLAGGYDTDTATEDIGLSLKLISKHGNLKDRIIYAADVVAMTEGVQTFDALLRQRFRWKLGSLQNLYKYRALFMKSGNGTYSRMLTMYRLPMAILSELLLLLAPVILWYVFYLSVRYNTPSIVLGAYISTTLYSLWTLWPDEHLTVQQKLKLSAISTVMYVLFFIMDAVQIYAMFSSIKDYKNIFNPAKGKEVWVSPERSGQATSFTST